MLKSLAAALLATLLLALPGHARAFTPSVFHTAEQQTNPPFMLPQWDGVLHKIAAETPAIDACVEHRQCPSEGADAWAEMLSGLAGKPRRAQIRMVNEFVNSFPYVTDQQNYGVEDHWATPLEFLARAGDCEDYAITKYVSLRHLGVAADDLRVTIVRDEVRDLAHAILLVRVDGDWLVLDNLAADVEPQASVTTYQPYYSVNEVARWVHTAPVQVAQGEVSATPASGQAN